MRKILMSAVAVLTLGTVGAVTKPAHADHASVTVINRCNQDVLFMYITRAGERTWGNDQMDIDQVIGPGRQRTWTINFGRCHFDLKAELENGRAITRYNANLCGGAEWTLCSR